MIVRGMICAMMMALITGCEDDPANPTKGGTFYGSAVAVGNGTAKSYVVLNNDGNPTELGVVMSETALAGLPAGNDHSHMGNMFTLQLPSQASATAFNHISLDWNPLGHEPEQIYGLAHFDFHFYTISQQERTGITAVGDDTVKVAAMPAEQYRPAGYVMSPGGVPQMGAHWIDPTSPELSGQTFTETFLYGSYDGKMIFMEPMITKAYLESHPNLTEQLKLPQAYQKSGYYPTTYTVRYNASSKEYMVTLGNMVKR